MIGKTDVGRLRPCLDLERGAVVSDVAWAERWVGRFRAFHSYLPMLYGSTSLIAPMRQESSLLRACPWWRAEYGPNNGQCWPLQNGRQGASIHQYTSVGRLTGISGDCDVSTILSYTGIFVPGSMPPVVSPAWRWAEWYVGIGPYKGKGHYAHEHGVPDSSPPPLPANMVSEAWAAVRWYTKHGVGA